MAHGPIHRPVVRLSVAEVLAETWNLYTRFAPRLILMAMYVFGFIALIQAVIATTGVRYLGVITAVVTVVGIYWLQGALAVAVKDLRDGKREIATGEVFARVEKRLPALIGAGLLVAVGVGAWVLILLWLSSPLPAIALAAASVAVSALWICVVPAVVIEHRRVVDSFRRSHRLVRGDFLRVVAIVVLTTLFASIIAAVLRALFAPLPTVIEVLLGGIVANSVAMPILSLAWTLTYLDLRLNKG